MRRYMQASLILDARLFMVLFVLSRAPGGILGRIAARVQYGHHGLRAALCHILIFCMRWAVQEVLDSVGLLIG